MINDISTREPGVSLRKADHGAMTSDSLGPAPSAVIGRADSVFVAPRARRPMALQLRARCSNSFTECCPHGHGDHVFVVSKRSTHDVGSV